MPRPRPESDETVACRLEAVGRPQIIVLVAPDHQLVHHDHFPGGQRLDRIDINARKYTEASELVAVYDW